jgi:Tfp pilus assembly protein PilN
MIRINLLPEEFHVKKKKLRIAPRGGFVIAGVVVLFLIMALLAMWQKSRVGRLDEQIQQVRIEAEQQRADLALVERLTALKEKILQRMQAVETLNRNRTRWIDILTELNGAVPADMWLVSFKEETAAQGSGARIQGMTFSLKPIALFMDHLDEGKWFLEPQFTYARRTPIADGMAYDFELLSGLFSYQQQFVNPASGAPEAATGGGNPQSSQD